MTQRSVTIEIRPADSEEAVASTRLLLKEYASALGRHLSFEEFARELTDLPGEYGPPHGVLLLASCNGRLAGCVALRPLDEGLCEMRRLYVRHQFRGKGVGKRLSLAVIDEARERGYRAMRISLAPWMEEAIADLPFSGVSLHRTLPARAAQRCGVYGVSAALNALRERSHVRRFEGSEVRPGQLR